MSGPLYRWRGGITTQDGDTLLKLDGTWGQPAELTLSASDIGILIKRLGGVTVEDALRLAEVAAPDGGADNAA